MIPTDAQLRDFLLRRLPADEAASLADAIIVEEGVAERLRLEEYDLIDDHVGGRLNAADSAAVTAHLLNVGDARESLLTAQALARIRATPVASRPRWLRPRWLRPTLAAGGLLAAGIAALLLLPRWDGTGLDRVAHAEIGARPGGLPSPAPLQSSAPPQSPAPPLQTVTLLADLERGAPRTVHWRMNPRGVRLQVEIADAIPEVRYALRIADGDDRELFVVSDLAPRTAGHYRFVDVIVPAAVLGAGTRLISLRPLDETASAPSSYRWNVEAIVDP